jgi:hypothetical protein
MKKSTGLRGKNIAQSDVSKRNMREKSSNNQIAFIKKPGRFMSAIMLASSMLILVGCFQKETPLPETPPSTEAPRMDEPNTDFFAADNWFVAICRSDQKKMPSTLPMDMPTFIDHAAFQMHLDDIMISQGATGETRGTFVDFDQGPRMTDCGLRVVRMFSKRCLRNEKSQRHRHCCC